MADPKFKPNPDVKFPKLEKCFNCQSDLTDKRFCDVCKEISPSSSSSSVPIESKTEHYNSCFGDTLENGLLLVDTTSELMSYEPFCSQTGQYFHLYPTTTVTQPTDCEGFKQPEENNLSWCESSPSSTGQMSSASSEEECAGCATCGQAADTCVMHVSSRHLDFCYTCASYCFQAGLQCPVCQQRIVYIYMYKDTYLECFQ